MEINDKVIISMRASKKVRSGYPWVYSNDVRNGRTLPPLCAAPVEDETGKYAGFGVFNRNSLIQLRIITRRRDPDIAGLIRERIRGAFESRQELYPGFSSLRMFFAESDGLPGLIIDKYEDNLVIEMNSKGMMPFLDEITSACVEIFAPVSIILKNTATSLRLEGLEEEKRVLYGTPPSELIIRENGILFHIDPLNGQKTGFFFDQKDNRLALARLSGDRTFLDLFSYTGSWGLYALKHGAKNALFVDSSPEACAYVKRNLSLNGFKNGEVVNSDVFDFMSGNKEHFGACSLDPPAFAKSAKDIKNASKAYVHLNRNLFKMMSPGGIAATSSCSYHISDAVFGEILEKAAYESGQRVFYAGEASQAKDHPVPIGFPESRYLTTRFIRRSFRR